MDMCVCVVDCLSSISLYTLCLRDAIRYMDRLKLF